MQYELHKGLHRSKRTEAATLSQLVRKIQRQADTNAGRFLSSRSAWDRANLGPGVVEMVLNSGWQISEFFCNVKGKMCACGSLIIKGWGHEMLIHRIIKRKLEEND